MAIRSITLNKLIQVIDLADNKFDLAILTSMFVLNLGLLVAAVINYRRSVQTANKTKRLHNEAKEAYNVAQQFYLDAIQTLEKAHQSKDEAEKAMQDLTHFWATKRSN